MMRVLSRSRMVDLWLLRKGYEPMVEEGAEVERSDDVGLRAIALEEARAWYARLLDTGPAEWLSPMDYSRTTLVEALGGGVAVLTLPSGCRRLLRLRMEGWRCDARLVEAGSAEALRQANPLWRSGGESPVAVVEGRRVTVYGAGEEPRVAEARGVEMPTDGSFIFDDAALGEEMSGESL